MVLEISSHSDQSDTRGGKHTPFPRRGGGCCPMVFLGTVRSSNLLVLAEYTFGRQRVLRGTEHYSPTEYSTKPLSGQVVSSKPCASLPLCLDNGQLSRLAGWGSVYSGLRDLRNVRVWNRFFSVGSVGGMPALVIDRLTKFPRSPFASYS